MVTLRTVLCPVDLSPASSRQVDTAEELCRAFGARLVVHHNLVKVAVGSGVGWMWAANHQLSEDAADRQLRELLARVSTAVPVEARVTHGPVADAVLRVAEAVEADVVVLDTRGPDALGDENSVTELVLERATCSVLALHRSREGERRLRLTPVDDERQVVLVATDLRPTSQAAVGLALDLARRLPIDLHVLHVTDGTAARAGGAVDDPRQLMAGSIPHDLPREPVIHLESGEVAATITRMAASLGAACIVMGEHAHTRALWRHWLRPDAPRGVLHRAPCPIWYVPPPRTT